MTYREHQPQRPAGGRRSDTGPVPTPAVGQILTVEVELPANHGFEPKCIHCQGAVARISNEDQGMPTRRRCASTIWTSGRFPNLAGVQTGPATGGSFWTA